MRLTFLAIALVVTFNIACAETTSEAFATFSEADICRAAISTIMGRPVHKVKVEKIARDGVVFLFYIRPDDSSIWSFKCFTEKNEVTWGNADGRWRVDPYDSKITYFASDELLTINEDYGDGSNKKEHFNKAELERPYR